jgi:hypothetical protein
MMAAGWLASDPDAAAAACAAAPAVVTVCAAAPVAAVAEFANEVVTVGRAWALESDLGLDAVCDDLCNAV